MLLERFERGHVRGSSHGAVRIFRLSYTDPDYVLLGLEALVDWKRLERDSRRSLVVTTGALDIGPEAGACGEAMTACGVEVQVIEPEEVLDRYGLHVNGPALHHGPAGVLAADGAVEAQLELAERAGARVRFSVQMEGVERRERGLVVSTSAGTVEAKILVIAAGAWAPALAESAGMALPALVTCEQISYFDAPGLTDVPVLIDRNDPTHYLVPAAHDAPGVKVGVHRYGRPVDPDDGPFELDPSIAAMCASWLERVSGFPVREVSSETCLYTNAPDEDFVLKRYADVVLVSACSGHGFKFAPRMGRAVADLVENKDPRLPGRLGEWWRD